MPTDERAACAHFEPLHGLFGSGNYLKNGRHDSSPIDKLYRDQTRRNPKYPAVSPTADAERFAGFVAVQAPEEACDARSPQGRTSASRASLRGKVRGLRGRGARRVIEVLSLRRGDRRLIWRRKAFGELRVGWFARTACETRELQQDDCTGFPQLL